MEAGCPEGRMKPGHVGGADKGDVGRTLDSVLALERRRRGDQTGLETRVVHAEKAACWVYGRSSDWAWA